MADTPTVTTYINELNSIIEDIEFSGGTLSSKKIIKLYERMINHKPQTVINIFNASIRTEYLESQLNERTYSLVIRIRCKGDKREEKAQNDLSYLEEAIIEKLENKLSTINWLGGFLNNEDISSIPRNFFDEYYTKDIPIQIKRRVTVNN